MLLSYYMIPFVPESSTTFSVSHDHVIVVTVTYNIMLILTLSPKIRNKWNKNKNKKKNENKPSLIFMILTSDSLMSTFQYKLDYTNLFSHSRDKTCSY